MPQRIELRVQRFNLFLPDGRIDLRERSEAIALRAEITIRR